jgi:ferric iron reductase protein FhuF
MQILKKQEARSPTLQTVLMVEKFIDDNSGAHKKTELWNSLPKKVMWQTFQVIMEYLEENGKIAYDNAGYVVYIWNPELVKRFRNKPELEWNAK